jgi:hypothetical protein
MSAFLLAITVIVQPAPPPNYEALKSAALGCLAEVENLRERATECSALTVEMLEHGERIEQARVQCVEALKLNVAQLSLAEELLREEPAVLPWYETREAGLAVGIIAGVLVGVAVGG